MWFGSEERGTQEQVACTQRATSPATSAVVLAQPSCFAGHHAQSVALLWPPNAGPPQDGARGDRISHTGLRSRSQYATSRGNRRGFCRRQCPSICVSSLCETDEGRRLGRRSTPAPTYRAHCQEQRRCHEWSTTEVQQSRKRQRFSHSKIRGGL